MDRELFSLAFQGTFRRKKSSGLIFLVLLLSFSFIVVSLSLTGSITKTNEELGKNTYGEWYYAVPSGKEEDAAWLAEQREAGLLDCVGTMRNYGTIAGSAATDSINSGIVGFGTWDADMIKVGRLSLDKGSWPSGPNEIAMEENTLYALGYDTTLGQEVELSITFPYSSERLHAVTQKFVLCGVLHGFSNLWTLNQNKEGRLLVSAVVTPDTAEAVQAVAKAAVSAQDAEQIAAVPQYFISSGSKTRGKLGSKLNTYLQASRTEPGADTAACTNTAVLASGTSADYNKTYLYMIAAVTVLAVLSVYIIHLPAELHRFATLRSIGITKQQLAQLVALETLIPAVPAVVLGTLCGALCTKLALRLLVYSGSIAIQVAIPYLSLLEVTLLWALAVLAARFLLFAVTVRVPLTGRFSLQGKKAQQMKKLRGGMIAVLLALFGFVVVFTKMEVLLPEKFVESYQNQIHYSIAEVVSTEEGLGHKRLSEQNLEFFRQIPGASLVFGASNFRIGLSFPGMEERTARFIVLDSDLWDRAFDFGEDAEAFSSGELVLMCVPGTDVLDMYLSDSRLEPENRIFLRPEEDISNRDYLLPEGEVDLHFYANDGSAIGEVTSAVSVRRISADTIWKNNALYRTMPLS